MRRLSSVLAHRSRARSSTRLWTWAGDANASILVAGHSHRGAYSDAITEGLATGVAVLVARPPVDPAAVPRPDKTYWSVACSAPCRVLAVVWNGNQFNRHFLFEFEEPLRLHDSGAPGTAVPASMISALWEPSLASLDANVTAVRAEHLVLVGTPPPKTDEAIRAGLASSPMLGPLGAAGESADTIRITPAAVRVGLWKILQADYERRAARIGAIFVPVPASAQTPDGCLKPEYSMGDASHANGAFGALMLGEVEAAVVQAELVRR